jgi:hypothetical protein
MKLVTKFLVSIVATGIAPNCIGPPLSRTRCGRISLDKMKAGSSMSHRFANIDHWLLTY